jgi:uncharacterized membrane protein
LGEVRQPGHSSIGEHLVINVIRLVTVHPFLVHFSIGILPVMVLGYAAAVWFKSERWSFVGDAATVACAGIPFSR